MTRLNTNGSLDTSFDGDGKQTIDFGSYDDGATVVALDGQGRIVVAGYFHSGTSAFAVARLNIDRSLPDCFSGDGVGKFTFYFGSYDDRPTGVAVDEQGRIVVAGYSYNYQSCYDFAVARLKADFSLDTSFDGDGIITTDIGRVSAGAVSWCKRWRGRCTSSCYSCPATRPT